SPARAASPRRSGDGSTPKGPSCHPPPPPGVGRPTSIASSPCVSSPQPLRSAHPHHGRHKRTTLYPLSSAAETGESLRVPSLCLASILSGCILGFGRFAAELGRSNMRLGLLVIAAFLALPAHAPGQSGRTVDWPRVGNDPGCTRYSALDQINRDNVARLKP